jgi:hypothetical protein
VVFDAIGDNVGRNPNDEEDGEEEHQGEVSSRTFFAHRVRWLVLAQTDGEPYATAQREVAISPVAALPHKTLFHQVAHILLDHPRDNTVGTSIREVEAEGVALLCCEALELEGAAYARPAWWT